MSIASPTVLIVEDEPPLRALVQQYCVQAGYHVLTAADGPSALAQARQHRPDVLVLDIMLPGIDGLEVCRQLRSFSDAYVLMLTARADEIDRVVGLEVGADDYLTKPFSPRELVARIKALLRRPRTAGAMPDADVRTFGGLVLNADARQVTLFDTPLNLTPTEYALLERLSAHPNRVLTRAQLLEHVWGTNYAADDHVVDVHVANLRRKLGSATGTPRIETVRGAGYRLDWRSE